MNEKQAALAEAQRKHALAQQALAATIAGKNATIDEAKRKQQMAKKALTAALNDARTVGLSLEKTTRELNASEEKVARLEAAKAAAEEASSAVARKLIKVNSLNSALREKLDTAKQEIAAVMQQKVVAEQKLAAARVDYEKRLDANEKRLAFASTKLARVASELKEERARSQRAQSLLKENAELLTIARAEAQNLEQTVQNADAEDAIQSALEELHTVCRNARARKKSI